MKPTATTPADYNPVSVSYARNGQPFDRLDIGNC